MKRILLVEDDQKYLETLRTIIEENNYQVKTAVSALSAMEMLAFNDYDLIISDLYMDSVNGIQFLKYVKRTKPFIKTMILTGSPSMDTELQSLDIYVDKYLVKETSTELLLKYIEVILSDSDKPKEIVELRDDNEEIVVNLKSRSITRAGEQVKLSQKQYAIAVYLLEHHGVAVSREELFEGVWDTAREDVDLHVIDAHIKDIRKKLKVNAIITVRGYGYKWEK